jgi:pimeloyl-ACP methyl ester carboxylesterase
MNPQVKLSATVVFGLVLAAFGNVGWQLEHGADLESDVSSSKKADYTIISAQDDPSITAPLRKIDTIVQAGSDARNRFTMHRIFQPGDHRGSIILVPSLANNFREYLISANNDPMQSLAAHLALENYDVYGFSSRTSNLGPNACSSRTVDCSIMKDWDLQAYLDDVDFIRRHATHGHGPKKPAIGGLSLGGILGVAAVDADPSAYSGLLLWEAILYSADPTIRTLNMPNCTNVRDAIAAGVYYDEFPNQLKQLAQAGEAATLQFFGNPQPALFSPNWIQLVPDATHTRFKFASFPRVYEFVLAFDNIVSLALVRDLQCGFSGERTYTSNLKSFKGPIFAIKAGQGFGPYMDDTINLTRSRNIRIQDNSQFGHLDAYLVADHARYIEQPIVQWLNEDVFPDGN